MISDNTHIASDFPAWSAQNRSVLLFLLTKRMLAPLNRNEASFLEERTTRGAEAHARQREVVQTEAVQKPAHKLQQLSFLCCIREIASWTFLQDVQSTLLCVEAARKEVTSSCLVERHKWDSATSHVGQEFSDSDSLQPKM